MQSVKDARDIWTRRGLVRGYWFNPLTQEKRGHFIQRNQLSYACGDVLAKVMGGSVDYAPRYIGFIYGSNSNPTELSDPTQRQQTWDDLGTNMAAIGGNIQISPITLTPTFVVDGSTNYYSGNGVIFSAHTRSESEGTYGFPLVSPYASELTTGSYLYHAMLLTKLTSGAITYIPVARVTLGTSGVYAAKPTGFELALEWQISFF